MYMGATLEPPIGFEEEHIEQGKPR
jgi:hypothetical protein